MAHSADEAHEHADDGHVHVHVHPTKFYAGILGALLFLTVLTVAVSYVDIDGMLALGREVEGVGAWNLGVAVLIATMKASLVVLFFMHLKDDKRFNALVFVGSLLFIGVFFAYTMNDTNTRGATGDAFNGVHIDPETGLRAPGGISGQIPGQVLEEGLIPPDEVEAEGEAAEGPDPVEAGENAAADEGATGSSGADDPSFIDDILGEEEEPAAEEAVQEGDGDDFINDIMGDEDADNVGDEPEAPAPE